ncbi:MAG: zinc ABC transporter substrate-binding protein [Chloroflexi bacterium]|nr:zinc ABC transporter substrate-binding protein [Chloroflexota bacterium]MCY4248198.1 zinc ABC transporter substrate-binding protein [Chloroflexota bacterium]
MSQHRWLLAWCWLLLAAPSLAVDASLHIVATTTQAADLAQVLGAGVDGVHITPLMGAGVDPHLYQPTESDIAAMNRAQMVIYNGLRLEGQFDTVFAALAEQGVSVYALSAPVKSAGFVIGGFALSDELTDVDDPHFWFDPRNWQLAAQGLAERLARLDPVNATAYQANADAYSTQLQQLFAWAEAGLLSVEERQRYLVTSHDAFQYFGAAFGWQMQAIQGISTEDEAGVGDIQATVDFVLEHDIPVLFVESSVPPDTIEAVVAALRAQGHETRIGIRELYGDAMDAPDSFGGAYIGMLAQNALTIMQSYACMGAIATIPDWPADLLPEPPDELWNANCHA